MSIDLFKIEGFFPVNANLADKNIYVYWFPSQMMFVPFSSNTMGVTSVAGTANHSRAHEFTPFFNLIRVTRSLALCVCFVDRFLSFCSFTFGHCVVCVFSIFGFWYYCV